MTEYVAEIEWERHDAPFTDNRYSRAHLWRFDGGVEVPASSSPHVVPLPYSAEHAVDPEEAFVASLASCHMLFFLSLVATRGYMVERYIDAATGEIGRNAQGRQAMVRVTLHPDVTFSGATQPTAAEIDALHHAAHESCFIASSVTTDVRVEPKR